LNNVAKKLLLESELVNLRCKLHESNCFLGGALMVERH